MLLYISLYDTRSCQIHFIQVSTQAPIATVKLSFFILQIITSPFSSHAHHFTVGCQVDKLLISIGSSLWAVYGATGYIYVEHMI